MRGRGHVSLRESAQKSSTIHARILARLELGNDQCPTPRAADIRSVRCWQWVLCFRTPHWQMRSPCTDRCRDGGQLRWSALGPCSWRTRPKQSRSAPSCGPSPRHVVVPSALAPTRSLARSHALSFFLILSALSTCLSHSYLYRTHSLPTHAASHNSTLNSLQTVCLTVASPSDHRQRGVGGVAGREEGREGGRMERGREKGPEHIVGALTRKDTEGGVQ